MAEYFTLNTGAHIPSVGLGTWQSVPGAVGNAVEVAVKAGYRHIDCARVYKNEKEIGQALKKLFDDQVVKRGELFITSKLWSTDHDDVAEALNASLNDLELDYLDLYLIHMPFRLKKGEEPYVPEKLDIKSTWAALEKLYDSGKVRAIGVSNFTTKKLEELLSIARVPPAANQVECHPVWQQEKLRSFCGSNGIHLSAYSPLGSPGTTWINENVLENTVVKEIAETLGKTPAQVALRWGIQKGLSVLPKTTNEARVMENFDIFGWSIPEDLFAKFSEIPQKRLQRCDFFTGPESVYKSVEEFWDGEL